MNMITNFKNEARLAWTDWKAWSVAHPAQSHLYVAVAAAFIAGIVVSQFFF